MERNNRIGNLIVDESFHLWTSGKVGAYVRYVVDGQRFGFHPELEVVSREVQLSPAGWRCQCGAVVSEAGGRRSCRNLKPKSIS